MFKLIFGGIIAFIGIYAFRKRRNNAEQLKELDAATSDLEKESVKSKVLDVREELSIVEKKNAKRETELSK